MVSAAEIMVLLGVLVGAGAIFVGGFPRKALAGFIGIVLFGAGTAFGGLAWAGIPAFVEVPGVSPPVATGLYTVSFLSSSDTDRTENGETVSGDGQTITYIMNDANMDGLGDVNLDVRVVNQNVGDPDAAWPFEVVLTYVGFTIVSGLQQPIVNRTDSNTRHAVTYTLTDSGSPTLTQQGERAFSNDFRTGLSDTLNVDFEMNPTATDDLAAGGQLRLEFTVGGVLMRCILLESA